MTVATSTLSGRSLASVTSPSGVPTPMAQCRVPSAFSREVTRMVEPEFGPKFRVFCEPCDVETTVPSQIVAEDMVDAHREESHCPNAQWEEADDAGD